MNLNEKLKQLEKEALNRINEKIEIRFILINSKFIVNKHTQEPEKYINEEMIEVYLKKKGYYMNYILGRRVMIKDFTCVFVHKDCIEVWHDKTNNKSNFVHESYLTNLPIILNYMEKI